MIPRRFFILWTATLVFTAAITSAKEPASKWEKEIAAFEAADKKNPPKKGGIVFTGSSSIRLWKTLETDFPHHNVLNRGFGGSQISDAIQFIDRIVVPYEPRMIVMYSGGNDINAGESPEQVAGDFRTFTEKVREKLPNVRILYIAISPNPARWKEIVQVRQANKLIEEYCSTTPGLAFIDTFSKMLGEEGLPRPEIFTKDNLHMNEKGYELWRDIVGPFLGPADSDKGTAPAPKTISDPKPAATPKNGSGEVPVPAPELDPLPAKPAGAQ
ncbi:MAG: SGNH/GDSL hydrolase family protein [Chthoniobacteraceae bacterium]